MNYCCEKMEEYDQELIDFCPGSLVTIDKENKAYPINHCPWCGTKFENPVLDRLEKAAVYMEETEGKSLEEVI